MGETKVHPHQQDRGIACSGGMNRRAQINKLTNEIRGFAGGLRYGNIENQAPEGPEDSGSASSVVEKLTARPGTIVEMACL